uniref:peptidylprolyl isomerase n=1 Tax=Globisporangium ultimum (strain ATCC 200006 / CBS 805.95 / DAOM BR144) TaxID=431595 RepID=K3WIR8_GLOUD
MVLPKQALRSALPLRVQQRSFVRAAVQLGVQSTTTRISTAAVTRALPVCAIGSASFYSSDSTSSAGSESIAIGDRVYLHMQGQLSNGEKFGLTEKESPISFIVGSGEVIVGIEEAVVGLQKGVTKSVEIEPAKAFGVEKEIHTVPRSQLNLSPEDEAQLAVGLGLQLQNGQQARIVKVTDESIDIDLSHPYAGETLFIDLTIVDHVAHSELSSEQQIVLPEEISPGDNTNFPHRGDMLVMHYVGKLASNGNVFDSSRDRGQPFQFQIGVGQVIKGWDEGVMRMSKGQKAILNIPSAKGYGRSGAGGVIPPDADLIFEVELLDIIKN